MKRSIFWFIAIVLAVIALSLWLGKKKSMEISPITVVETNVALPAATKPREEQSPMVSVHPNPPIIRTASNGSAPSAESQEQKAREALAQFNNVDIVFYGRLEDQFGNAVGNAQIKFEVPFNDGQSVGVHRGTTMADGNGFFTISGYKGKSLDAVPIKAGYVLASTNGGGIYSQLWTESERIHPDPNKAVVITMWKLQGAEPLVDISKEYKLPFTDSPINFDLVAGKIVPIGGDLKITVKRPVGIISQQHPQNWSIHIEVIDGGLIETSFGESRIAYSAPEDGYEIADDLGNNNGPDLVDKMFFVQSRNGQVYSKVHLLFGINETPDKLMSVTFSGVANTNSSRNWEAASK